MKRSNHIVTYLFIKCKLQKGNKIGSSCHISITASECVKQVRQGSPKETRKAEVCIYM